VSTEKHWRGSKKQMMLSTLLQLLHVAAVAGGLDGFFKKHSVFIDTNNA
jgi:hypothetical protein